MYRNYYNYGYPSNFGYRNYNDNRLIGGGFIAPFLLGGLAGAALAPSFYRPYPQYYSPPYYPRYWW
ncbi:MAG: hypothetical protein WCX96_01720 [Bacilli bacterium]